MSGGGCGTYSRCGLEVVSGVSLEEVVWGFVTVSVIVWVAIANHSSSVEVA